MGMRSGPRRFQVAMSDLVVAPRRMAKLLVSITAVMVVPPVLAGVLGSIGLAVVVGILSIFAGLLFMAFTVSRWELFQHRVRLPKARLVERNHGGGGSISRR